MFRTVQIDWNVFKTVNSGKEEKAFERLSYCLFCYEFKQPIGVFRYFNQHSIETQPVEINDEVVGFQSKFYDASVTLSSKEQELTDTVNSAKIKYPQMTKLCFYINKKFTQNKKGTAPKYKLNIEKAGKSIGVTVEWRVLSHFEQMLALPELAHICDLYFNNDKGISYFCNQVFTHRDLILDAIGTEITYKGNTICFNHSLDNITHFINNSKNVLFIQGLSGIGKSAVIKKFVETVKDTIPVALFRATDINVSIVAELSNKFGNYTLDDFLKLFNNENQKVIIIDSAEKILFFENQQTTFDVINSALKHNWKLILTVKRELTEALTKLLNQIDKPESVEISVSIEELKVKANEHNIILPTNKKMLELLCRPMFLKLWIDVNKTDINNISAFFDVIWSDIILKTTSKKGNMPVQRKDVVLSISQNEFEGNYSGYSGISKSDVLSLLEQDGILIQHPRRLDYEFSHDVFGQIAAEQLITDIISNNPTKCQEFVKTLYAQRVFREFLKRNLTDNNLDVLKFVKLTLQDDTTNEILKNIIQVALLSSDAAQSVFNDCFSFCKDSFSIDKLSVLLKHLKTACQKENEGLYVPYGSGWQYGINLAYENVSILISKKSDITLLFEILEQWTLSNPTEETTKKAGKIALTFYKHIAESEWSEVYEYHKNEKSICNVLLLSAIEINKELNIIFEEAISEEKYEGFNHEGINPQRRNNKYEILCNTLLKTYYGARFIATNFNLFSQVADYFWKFDCTVCRYKSHLDVDEDFGLESFYNDFYPASALQSPLYIALQNRPVESIDYIINLVNYSTAKYIESDLATNELTSSWLFLQNESPREIQISTRLWCAYRGTHVSPYLFMSALMALEKYLSDLIKDFPNDLAVAMCISILKKQLLPL